MAKPKPIADDIPLDKAWKIGRRVYVRCGYMSSLNTQLREIGATWDRDVRALWVGTGKVETVLPLVRAQVERVAAVNASNRWVTIPYDATDIRAAAKATGAIWDANRKQWAMTTDEAYTAITTQVQQWTDARDAARAAQREAERLAREELSAADAVAAVDAAKVREMALITHSGRTATTDRVSIRGRLHGRMYRDKAELAKPQPGTVRKLGDGRRVLVLTCTVEFFGQDDIDDGPGWPMPWENPGWYWTYEGVVVEPTTEESDEDAKRTAELADEKSIERLVHDIRAAADLSDGTAKVPDGQTIEITSGSVQPFWDGRITLTTDGLVWWEHPGYYDDWLSVIGQITDECIISRVRETIAAGSRIRGRYEVRA